MMLPNPCCCSQQTAGLPVPKLGQLGVVEGMTSAGSQAWEAAQTQAWHGVPMAVEPTRAANSSSNVN